VSRYSKAIVAFIGAVATWAGTALADDGISNAEWALLAAALATTFAVYQARNVDPGES
jgi:hypothetical protein